MLAAMVLLQKWQLRSGIGWSRDGALLQPGITLGALLAAEGPERDRLLVPAGEPVPESASPLAPVDDDQEVWAAGVTYLRSRDARMAESEASATVYDRVYEARRPELFFKAAGWRVVGPGGRVRCRADSAWDVPEPELTLVIDARGEAVGYTAGNDVSSRSIEGENPLYLPQAKIFDGACALGHGIVWGPVAQPWAMPVGLEIRRGGGVVFSGATDADQIQRTARELIDYLRRELSFPRGVLLMTGTGIVPGDGFSLDDGDEVSVRVGEATLCNTVSRRPTAAS